MNRERAETYLRLQAEAGVRRAAILLWSNAARAGCTAQVMRVAQVLMAAGALDAEVADQILDEFELAFGTRPVLRAGGQPCRWPVAADGSAG
jgi:hypothetical protein